MMEHSAADRADAVAALVASGATYRAAAERFGRSYQSAYAACRCRGVRAADERRDRAKLSPDDLRRIDWAKGDTDIAATLSVSRERVRQIRLRVAPRRPEFSGLRASGVAIRVWLSEHRAEAASLDVAGGLAASRVAVAEGTYRAACRALGIVPARCRPLPPLTRESVKGVVIERPVRDGMTPCWHLAGNERRYPMYAGDSLRRQAYAACRGPLAPGQKLAARCANARCVNPGHMTVVSDGNVMRHRRDRGPVTASEAASMCRDRAAGMTYDQLADKYDRAVNTVVCGLRRTAKKGGK